MIKSKMRVRSVLNSGEGGEASTSTPSVPFSFHGVENPNPARFWLAILNRNEGISYTMDLCAISSERALNFEV